MDNIELESKVKELIKESILSNEENASIFNGYDSKYEAINAFLTDIMSLGYNDNSVLGASEDIYEIQSQMPWIEVKKSDILSRVEKSSLMFNKEIKAFSLFHKSMLINKDNYDILNEIKLMLEN